MKRVLIVDDDTIIRITLRSLVDWESLGYTIVADAIHGKQALALMENIKVDLVITDMKMPVLDGIGLLEAMNQKKGSLPRVLVLSGYDDFKMVRDAFRLGAYDYLLKADLNGDLLEELLTRLNEEGWKEAEGENGGIDPDGEAPSLSRVLKEMAMGKRKIEDSFFEGEYLVAQFEIEDFYKQSERFKNDLENGLIRPMLEFAGQIPRVASRCILGVISPSRYVMLYQIKDSGQYRENVVSTCRQLCSVWNNYMNLPVSAGISSLGIDPFEFPERFEEAGEQLSLRHLKGKANISYPWEKKAVPYREVCAAGERYQELLRGLAEGDEELVSSEKKKLYADFYSGNLEHAKRTAYYVVCQLAWKFLENHDDISSVFVEEINYYEKVGRLEEIRSLELWMNNYFRWILDYIQHSRDSRQADIMIRAKRFIKDNYANPELTLGSVAGYVGLNEKYFSSRFTKEEGITFSNYLTDIRIRKAREMMEETDLKIYEISQNVGYNSVEHFTRVFKKIYKVSPGSFRK